MAYDLHVCRYKRKIGVNRNTVNNPRKQNPYVTSAGTGLHGIDANKPDFDTILRILADDRFEKVHVHEFATSEAGRAWLAQAYNRMAPNTDCEPSVAWIVPALRLCKDFRSAAFSAAYSLKGQKQSPASVSALLDRIRADTAAWRIGDGPAIFGTSDRDDAEITTEAFDLQPDELAEWGLEEVFVFSGLKHDTYHYKMIRPARPQKVPAPEDMPIYEGDGVEWVPTKGQAREAIDAVKSRGRDVGEVAPTHASKYEVDDYGTCKRCGGVIVVHVIEYRNSLITGEDMSRYNGKKWRNPTGEPHVIPGTGCHPIREADC